MSLLMLSKSNYNLKILLMLDNIYTIHKKSNFFYKFQVYLKIYMDDHFLINKNFVLFMHACIINNMYNKFLLRHNERKQEAKN